MTKLTRKEVKFEWNDLRKKAFQELKRRLTSCDAPLPGCPVDHRQPAETCVSHIMRLIHEKKWPRWAHISILTKNSTNYITIVSRVNYTLNTKHILKLVRSNIYIYIYIYIHHMNQGKSSARFITPASKERRLPVPVMYLKGGSHDRLSNGQ